MAEIGIENDQSVPSPSTVSTDLDEIIPSVQIITNPIDPMTKGDITGVIVESTNRGINCEDAFMNQSIIKNLNESMYNEALQYLRQQRISCMLAGAWFQIPFASTNSLLTSTFSSPGSSGSVTLLKTPKSARWRFCKLSGTKKTLHWADFPEQFDKKPSFDQLNERLDLSTVTDILTGLASPIHGAVSSAMTNITNNTSINNNNNNNNNNYNNNNNHIPNISSLTSIRPSSSLGSIANNGNNTTNYNTPPSAPTPPPPPSGQVSFIPGNNTSSLSSNISSLTVNGLNGNNTGSFRGRRPALSNASTTNSSTDLSAPCLSLMSGPNTSLLDVICVTSTQFCEWTDGLNVLLSRNITNKDSSEFIHSYTDIMVQLRLLDISADQLPLIGSNPPIPALPPDVNFYYDDVAGIGGLGLTGTIAPLLAHPLMEGNTNKGIIGDNTNNPSGVVDDGFRGPDTVEV